VKETVEDQGSVNQLIRDQAHDLIPDRWHLIPAVLFPVLEARYPRASPLLLNRLGVVSQAVARAL